MMILPTTLMKKMRNLLKNLEMMMIMMNLKWKLIQK